MAKLKTKAQLEQERKEAAKYALGNYVPDTSKLLLIYARQSSSKQYVSNIYSAMEQRDGLLERASGMGWSNDEQWILYVENQLAKKYQVSGSLRIDQRPGLQALTEVIESGKASAVLVVSVDRITRDEDLITPTQFANICKRYGVVIITDDYIYDFNNPNRDDMGRFMNEAIASKEYIRKQIKGKMLKNRTRKANMGLVANGVAPIGLMLDESRDNLVPSPHAERVDWLYGRFRALDANLASLLREVIGMARRGIPLFPDVEGWTPDHIHLKRMTGGWTVSTRFGLQYILTNPMYQGHLVFNGRIVKRNAHQAIVDADNWHYAFNHLSDVDLDGMPIDRPERTVRYTQKTGIDSGALLAGTRESGGAVIDGVNGAHVYVHMPDRRYLIKQWDNLTVSGYETSIDVKTLDSILVARLLYWLNAAERQLAYYQKENITSHYEHTPVQAMDKVEQTAKPTPTGANTIQGDLELTNQDLARVERALHTSADVMDDKELRETYEKQARLIRRRAELEQAIAQGERLAKQREQAKGDIETASEKWAKWTIEERRSFIRLVTESITLEEIASGWLRLFIVWSPIFGFIEPLTSNIRAVEIAYLWRQLGSQWAENELAMLRTYYPASPRAELLELFPTRSWQAIVSKAIELHVPRQLIKRNEQWPIPKDTSMSDMEVIKKYGLEPDKRVQWQHEIIVKEDTNESYHSCSA